MIKVTWLERVGWNRSSVRNVMCIGQTTTKFEASIPRNLRESDILHSFWSAFMCEGVRDKERGERQRRLAEPHGNYNLGLKRV